MRSFLSDNNSGASREVIESIVKANTDHAFGYGDDKWSYEAEHLIKKVFGKEVEVLFTFNGTGSNSVALQICTQPFGSVLCPQTGHIIVDECGAPTKMTGCQIIGIDTVDGKLYPDLIKPYLSVRGDQHHSQPQAIYISECTELGTVYTKEELRALTDFAHENNMLVHMDGARISNACATLKSSLSELTTDCGVDILSFGGTKNGILLGEAVIIFNELLKPNAKFIRKQSAQLASKQRFIACQYIAYLEKDLWLHNAENANQKAFTLAKKLSKCPLVTFTQKVESNQLFMKMPIEISKRLKENFDFYYINESIGEIRLVTSFDTTDEDINAFIASFEKALKDF